MSSGFLPPVADRLDWVERVARVLRNEADDRTANAVHRFCGHGRYLPLRRTLPLSTAIPGSRPMTCAVELCPSRILQPARPAATAKAMPWTAVRQLPLSA